MTARWDSEWDDEEWLKQQSITTLREVYASEPPAGVDKSAIKEKIKEMMTAEMKASAAKNFADASAMDMLSYAQIADGDTMKAEITDSESQKHTVMDILEYATRTRYEALADEDSLSGLLAARALLMANNKANEAIYENSIERVAESEEFQQKANDASQAMKDYDTKLGENKTNLESKLAEDSNFTYVEITQYQEAEKIGALESISEESKKAFIDTLARHSGWDKVNGQNVIANDNALASMGVNGLAPYDADGNLNPVYEQCKDLLDKIDFAKPAEDNTNQDNANAAPAQPQRLEKEKIAELKQQLLVNAAMRATNEILKDKSFLVRHKTPAEMLNTYKEMVSHQFERSIVLASLADSKETGVMLEQIVMDREGNIRYLPSNSEAQKALNQKKTPWQRFSSIFKKEDPDIKDKDVVQSAIEKIYQNFDEGNTITLHPVTVLMDSEDLKHENNEISLILRGKKVDENKLSFWKKAKEKAKAIYDNMVHQGGWVKAAVGLGVMGGAVVLASSGAVVAGAALYAGWSAASAWVMPVFDKLSQEMRENKIKGFKNKLKYIRANWKRARKEKYKEEGFKKNAWIQTSVGTIAGALVGATVGMEPSMAMTLTRQGVMAAGKAVSWFTTGVNRANAQQTYRRERTVKKFEALQNWEKAFQRDKAAFYMTLGTSIAFDAGQVTGLNDMIRQGVGDAVHNVSESVAGIFHKDSAENIVHTGTSGQTLNSVVEEQQTTTDSTLNNVVEEQQTTADATRRPAMVDKDGDGIPDYIQRPADQMDDLTSDSTATATQNVDRTGTGEVPAGDTAGTGETAAGESGSSDAAAGNGTPAQTAPQPGDILSKEEFGYGVTKTVTMGEKYNYIQYEGLPEGTLQTPDDFQSFLEHRIHNMNQYNKLVNVVDGAGNNVPLEQATDIMLKRLSEGRLDIPEGMTPEHALYIAYMKAHYFGDKSLLQTIACPDGAEAGAIHNQLALDSRLFNTAKIPGVPYGVPTDGMKLIDNSGTVNVKVCAPEVEHVEEVSRLETVELKDQAHAGSQPKEVPEYTGEQQTPQTVLTATYAGQKQDVPFDINRLTKDAQPEVININKDGNMVLWAKGEMTLPTGEAISRFEVETPVYLNPDLSNATLSNIVTKGAVRSYIFGEGDNALTVGIDKSGHAKVFLGQDEINLGSESARQVNDLIAKANERFGLTEADYTLGAGENQDNAFLNALDPEQKARAEELIARKTNRMEQDLEKAFDKAKEHPVELDEATKRTAMQNRLEKLAAEAEATDLGTKTSVTIEDRRAAAAAKIAEIRAGQGEKIAAGGTPGSSDNGIDSETKVDATTTEQEGVKAGNTVAETATGAGHTPDGEDISAELGRTTAQTYYGFTKARNYYLDNLKVFTDEQGQISLNDIPQSSTGKAFNNAQSLATNLAKEELFAQQMDAKTAAGLTLNEAETARLTDYEKTLKRYSLERPQPENADTGKAAVVSKLGENKQNQVINAALRARGRG